MQQWYCVPCKMGPIGALDYALCPKCGSSMTTREEEDTVSDEVTQNDLDSVKRGLERKDSDLAADIRRLSHSMVSAEVTNTGDIDTLMKRLNFLERRQHTHPEPCLDVKPEEEEHTDQTCERVFAGYGIGGISYKCERHQCPWLSDVSRCPAAGQELPQPSFARVPRTVEEVKGIVAFHNSLSPDERIFHSPPVIEVEKHCMECGKDLPPFIVGWEELQFAADHGREIPVVIGVAGGCDACDSE